MENIFPFFNKRQREFRLATKFVTRLFSHTSTPLFHKLRLLSERTQSQPANNITQNILLLKIFSAFLSFPNLYRTPVFPCYLINQQDIEEAIVDTTFTPLLENCIPSEWQEYLQTYSQLSTYQCIYFTDGSKKQELVGAAFYNSSNNLLKGIRLLNKTSIFNAEVIAIYNALKDAQKCQYPYVIICTDSKSTLQALQTPYSDTTQSIYITLLKSLINKMRQSNMKLQFLWTPGHAGIGGNEKVDKMARLATSFPNPAKNFLLTPQDLGHHYLSYPMEICQDASVFKDEENKIRVTRTFTVSKSKLPRKAIVMHYRMILSTFPTPQYLFNIKSRPNNLCDCGEIGTLNHIFLDVHSHRLTVINYYQKFMIFYYLKALGTFTLS